jgi:hypothetical protein
VIGDLEREGLLTTTRLLVLMVEPPFKIEVSITCIDLLISPFIATLELLFLDLLLRPLEDDDD